MNRLLTPAGMCLVACLLCCSFTAPLLAQPPNDRPTVDAAQRLPADEVPDWMARLEMARLLSYTERYEESLGAYRKVLEERPDLHEARVEAARVAGWAGRTEAAEEFLKGIPADQRPAESLLLLARAHITREEYAKARPMLLEYLQAHPDDMQARLLLAEMLSWMSKYDDSLAQFERILDARPDDIHVRRKYGFVLGWDGQRDKAIRQLERTLP